MIPFLGTSEIGKNNTWGKSAEWLSLGVAPEKMHAGTEQEPGIVHSTLGGRSVKRTIRNQTFLNVICVCKTLSHYFFLFLFTCTVHKLTSFLRKKQLRMLHSLWTVCCFFFFWGLGPSNLSMRMTLTRAAGLQTMAGIILVWLLPCLGFNELAQIKFLIQSQILRKC